MASKININLDTSKENYLVAKCKQNDDLTLEASIFENGLALDLTNKTITIQALKSDNTYIIQNTDIVKENNKINAELDRDFSRVPGTTKIEIVLVESSKQNTTFSFYLEVVGSVIRGAVQSSNTATILEALDNKIIEAGQVKQETEELVQSGGAATKGEVQEINASLEQKAQKSDVRMKSVAITEFDISDTLKQQINGNAPILQTVGDGIITPLKTTFIKSINLFNKLDVTNGYYIEPSNGNLVADTLYQASNFIKVKPNQKYVKNALNGRHAFYDINKNYIQSGGADTKNITAPSNAEYYRFSVKTTDVDIMLLEGEILSPSYIPYQEILEEKFLPEVKRIGVKSINKENLDFLLPSKNLFDKRIKVDGYYVNYNSGVLVSNSSYCVSGYIEVEPNIQYTVTWGHQTAFYDSNKVYISGVSGNKVQPYTFTTPSNAKYCMVSISLTETDYNTYQFEKGNTSTDYEEFTSVTVPIEMLPIKQESNNSTIVLPTNIYALNTSNLKVFYDNIAITDYPNVNINCEKGNQFSDRYEVNCVNNSGSFDLDIELRDSFYTKKINKVTKINVVNKSKTNTVKLLCIGDSWTRENKYSKKVQDTLIGVTTVGTRTYDNGVSCGEGRGGWTMNRYFTDRMSPFVFPSAITDGSKYFGSTTFWKKVCYEDSTGYDYEGFQKISKGWSGTDYLYDTNGFPKNPQSGYVVYNNTTSKFEEYNGTSWVALSNQNLEFSFSKYMQKYGAIIGIPNIVTLLMGANDFQKTDGLIGLTDFINKINTLISQIKAYDPSIKFIINIQPSGNNQDVWSSQGCSGSAEGYRNNMIKLAQEIINKYDNRSAENIFICPMYLLIDRKTKMKDWVHPTDEGQADIGYALASIVEQIR